VRVTWSAGLGVVGARHGEFEIDREAWNEYTPDMREALCAERYQEAVNQYLDGTWTLANAAIGDPVIVPGTEVAGRVLGLR
jgi:hypothetical protein